MDMTKCSSLMTRQNAPKTLKQMQISTAFPTLYIVFIRATIKKFETTGAVMNLPGRGRKCILPPREEDGSRGKNFSKDHSWRFAEVGGILESPSLQNCNSMPSPCQQAIWKACQKKASAVIKPQMVNRLFFT
ncbi:hypothetical protein AAFF_G00073200 [Aldrovandia affinis]|uniref:Uncharacterized protein n=1 Tax=Aldrovandia affinis TaxID=143900 RepID=A0AAD7S100_9TELE|nr:hypothetical protein AAFF_G00073200 [Aldrovandia affinis]